MLFSITAKDCRWDYFRGHGKGGQHRNKKDTAVRCTHKDSGAVGSSQEERSQQQNKFMAFKRMAGTKEFKQWINLESARKMGILKTIEESIERGMQQKNLKIEVKDPKSFKWIEEK